MPSQNQSLQTYTCTLPDGRALAYTRCGPTRGIPVVAHHGTPGSRLFVALLAESAISTGVQLIVPDRPGYGRSSPPPRDWSWQNWQDDMIHLLDTESIDQAATLGFSGGGPFALAAAHCDRITRLALVSTVVPPTENIFSTLSKVPLALRGLFRLSKILANISGPEAVVKQYTDRSVPETIAEAVADDFHEALRKGANAVVRETRLFTKTPVELDVNTPVRAWHGTKDENAPLSAVQTLMDKSQGTLITSETDHLETLLDHQQEMFEWLRTELI